jgi:hypothetical protein
MRSGASRLAIAWVAGLALAAPVSAQTASGAFKATPTGEIAPKVAAAYVVRDQFNPREKEIEIILSAAPVNVAKAVTDLTPHTTVINDPALKDTNYVLVWIKRDGKVSMNATFSKTMTQYIERTDTGGTFKAELTTNTADKVAGRIFTTAPGKTMDGATYTIDLMFSANVTKPPAGTALPAGGGDPGKALTAFNAARDKKDWAALKAALSPSATQRFVKSYNDDKENLTDTLDTLNFWLPAKDVKITGGMLMGDKAILDVEGTLASGVKALSLVRLVRTASGWAFEDAAMAGMLP